MTSSVILYGPRGEELSTPKTRQWAARERQAVRARYDAAQTSRENSRHWAQADHLGPNSEHDPAVRRVLRSRARYECANNTYASGMVRTLANDTIGTGPGLQITQLGIPKEDATKIENVFWDWCQAVDLARKLRLMRSAKARDGESFSQFFRNPRVENAVKLDLMPFEADMVAATRFTYSRISLLDGLFIDDFGNVIAYNVLREHPGENYQSLVGEADQIPASQIIHLFNADRPGQYRGVPEITPALPLFAQLRDYTLDVAMAARSAATPSWLLETQQPPSDMEFGDPFDTLDTERGMGVTLPAGYKMSQLKAEQPVTQYPAFKREILSEIARCLNIPYNVAAGDSSSYNYSSGRLDHRTYYKALRIERCYFETKALDRVFRLWWNAALDTDGYLPDSAYGLASVPMHSWRWDGDEHVDPTKEVDAAVSRIANGLTSIPDEVARLGGDAEVIHQKNAEFLGIPVAEYRRRLADKYLGPKPVVALPKPSADNTDSPEEEDGND